MKVVEPATETVGVVADVMLTDVKSSMTAKNVIVITGAVLVGVGITMVARKALNRKKANSDEE